MIALNVIELFLQLSYNMTGFALKIMKIVLNFPVSITDMTCLIFCMTGFVINMTGVVLNMTIFAFCAFIFLIFLYIFLICICLKYHLIGPKTSGFVLNVT